MNRMENAGMIKLCYSLADQSFAKTKSLGILNVSVRLANQISWRPEQVDLQVLGNDDLGGLLDLRPGTVMTRRNRPARSRLWRILWDQFGVYRAASRSKAGWLFLPKGFSSFCLPPPIPVAAIVHDVMIDHYRRHYPGFSSTFETQYFWRGFIATLRRASLIVTLTENSRSEILRVAREHGLTPPEVEVGGIGFARGFVQAKTDPSEVVVLTSRFPHKRTDLAVEFMARWQRQRDIQPVVHWIGGMPEGLALPDFPNWKRHQRLSETEFRSLIARSRALVFFSEYEGFGMPPVEATMVATAPVYSDITVQQEVMGGGGFPFSNSSHESFAWALDGALQCSPEVVESWAAKLLARHNWDGVGYRVVDALVSGTRSREVKRARAENG